MRETFLVHDIEVHTGDTRYTILTLQHPRGRIRSAPFWASEEHHLTGLERGALVLVHGTIGTWRDRPQLQVERIQPVPDAGQAWERLLPSVGDRAPWWALLDSWRRRLAAPRLIRTLALLFDDPGFRVAFGDCPGSTTGHHARLGGLLQHTCEVAQLALASARLHPRADPDLLLAGALLHDIGKLDAYTWRGRFELTAAGHAIGHVVLGAFRLDRALERAADQPCSPLERALLHHLILSHHGQLEFGAPVVPMTLEAQLLADADRTSARAASLADTIEEPEYYAAGNSTSRPIWQLEHRRLWRARSDWGRTETHD